MTSCVGGTCPPQIASRRDFYRLKTGILTSRIARLEMLICLLNASIFCVAHSLTCSHGQQQCNVVRVPV
jgi:hypothetical protein